MGYFTRNKNIIGKKSSQGIISRITQRGNGSVIGVTTTPTVTSAPERWDILDEYLNDYEAIWPAAYLGPTTFSTPVLENSTNTVTVQTIGIPVASTVYWTILPDSTNPTSVTDFYNSTVSGSFTVANNPVGSGTVYSINTTSFTYTTGINGNPNKGVKKFAFKFTSGAAGTGVLYGISSPIIISPVTTGTLTWSQASASEGTSTVTLALYFGPIGNAFTGQTVNIAYTGTAITIQQTMITATGTANAQTGTIDANIPDAYYPQTFTISSIDVNGYVSQTLSGKIYVDQLTEATQTVIATAFMTSSSSPIAVSSALSITDYFGAALFISDSINSGWNFDPNSNVAGMTVYEGGMYRVTYRETFKASDTTGSTTPTSSGSAGTIALTAAASRYASVLNVTLDGVSSSTETPASVPASAPPTTGYPYLDFLNPSLGASNSGDSYLAGTMNAFYINSENATGAAPWFYVNDYSTIMWIKPVLNPSKSTNAFKIKIKNAAGTVLATSTLITVPAVGITTWISSTAGGSVITTMSEGGTFFVNTTITNYRPSTLTSEGSVALQGRNLSSLTSSTVTHSLAGTNITAADYALVGTAVYQLNTVTPLTETGQTYSTQYTLSNDYVTETVNTTVENIYGVSTIVAGQNSTVVSKVTNSATVAITDLSRATPVSISFSPAGGVYGLSKSVTLTLTFTASGSACAAAPTTLTVGSVAGSGPYTSALTIAGTTWSTNIFPGAIITGTAASAGSLGSGTVTVTEVTSTTVIKISSTSSMTAGTLSAANFTSSVVPTAVPVLTFIAGTFTGGTLPTVTLSSSSTRVFTGTFTTPAAGNGTILANVTTTDGYGTIGALNQTAITIDTVAPTVSSITRNGQAQLTRFASAPQFLVTFSESVTGVIASNFSVSTGAGITGTPTIASVSGSGTAWTVTLGTSGVSGNNGVSGTASLGLTVVPGTNILDVATNALTSSTVSGTNEIYYVDNVFNGSLSSSPVATYIVNQSVTVTLTLTKAAAGTPTISISMPNSYTIGASTMSGSGLIWTKVFAVGRGNGLGTYLASAVDALGNQLTITSGNYFNIANETVAPTVSWALSGGPYVYGTTVTATATFSEAMAGCDGSGYTGILQRPQITITAPLTADNVSLANMTVISSTSCSYNYVIGRGQGSLVFAATGTDYAGNTVTVNSATITVVDSTAPTVTSVTAATTSGNYTTGGVITVLVNFSEPIVITGTPQLTLATGSPATTAVNCSAGGTGTSSTQLQFAYTVAAGNSSSDLSYSATTSLALNSGTIKDLAGNNATLTLPAVGAANSLNANCSIVVDTTAPTIALTFSATATSPANVTAAAALTYTNSISSVGSTIYVMVKAVITDSSAITAFSLSASGSTTISNLYSTAASSTTQYWRWGTSSTSQTITITASATDACTNVGSATNTFVVDTVGPTATLYYSSAFPIGNTAIAAGSAYRQQIIYADFDKPLQSTPTISISTANVGQTITTTAMTFSSGNTYTYTLDPTTVSKYTVTINATGTNGIALTTVNNNTFLTWAYGINYGNYATLLTPRPADALFTNITSTADGQQIDFSGYLRQSALNVYTNLSGGTFSEAMSLPVLATGRSFLRFATSATNLNGRTTAYWLSSEINAMILSIGAAETLTESNAGNAGSYIAQFVGYRTLGGGGGFQIRWSGYCPSTVGSFNREWDVTIFNALFSSEGHVPTLCNIQRANTNSTTHGIRIDVRDWETSTRSIKRKRSTANIAADTATMSSDGQRVNQTYIVALGGP